MSQAIRVDLAPHGFPEQWIELLDPRFYSTRRYEELVGELSKQDRTAEETEAFFRQQVSAWRVLDPDSGAVIGDPATADLKALPVGVVKVVTEQIVALFKGTVPNV